VRQANFTLGVVSGATNVTWWLATATAQATDDMKKSGNTEGDSWNGLSYV